MQATQRAMSPQNALANYRKQMNAVQGMRHSFNQLAVATGDWGVETVKTVSHTERLTKAISEQKLTLSQALRNLNSFKAAWREQAALQRSMTMQFTAGMTGKNQSDVYVPKNLGRDLDDARVKYGYINQAIASVAHQTVNWGKNTQWAGRQITVGIGVPLALAAAGMAKLGYQADQQLTRLVKVYDAAASQIEDTDRRQIATQQELQQVREAAMGDARKLAYDYGQSLSDTLELEADLAAVGKTGTELRTATTEVTRIATLGELDHQTALDMTISLMTAYNMSAKDLTETFNYMNAIENATSLSTQDFALAIPRAAGALANLGVDVKQFGVLLVALRAGGVQAEQGANALKSATTRLLRPTADAVDLFGQMNINISQLVTEQGGNLFNILGELGKRMQGFGQLQKQQAIAALFGTYQFNRLNVVLDGLGGALSGTADKGNQVAKALEVAGLSAGQLAQIADTEIQQFQQSVSGRFKRAVEGMKADFAQLGQAILPVLTTAVELLSDLVGWFNGLPDPAKKFIAFTAIIAGIAGPVIMLLGLFANLTGNLIKAGAAISNVFLRFKALTPEEVAQERLARAAARGYDTQASSAANLTLQLQKLLTTMERSNAQALTGGLKTGLLPGMQQFKVGAGAGSNQFMTIASHQAAIMAEESDKTRKSFGAIAGHIASFGVGVFALQNMLDSSGGLLDNLINAALVIGTFGSSGVVGGAKWLFTKGAAALMAGFRTAGKQLGFIGNLFKEMGKLRLTSLLSGLKAAGGLLGRIRFLTLGVFGPAGLLIAGAAIIATIISNMNDMAAAQERINESTKDWADILGYSEQTGSFALKSDTGPTSQFNARVDDVKKLTEANGELADSLYEAAQAGAGFQKVYQLSLREALKVISSGGSAAQARRAFQVSLQTAVHDPLEIERLTAIFDTIDLANPDDVREQLSNQVRQALTEFDIKSLVPGGLSGIWEDFFGDNISDAAEAKAKEAGYLFAQTFLSAANPQQQAAAFNEMQDQLQQAFGTPWKNALEELPKATRDQLHRAGIDGIDSFTQALKEGNPAAVKAVDQFSDDTKEILDAYRTFLSIFLTQFGHAVGLSDSEISHLIGTMGGLDSVASGLGINLDNTTTSTVRWGNIAEWASAMTDKFTHSGAGLASGMYDIDRAMNTVSDSADSLVNAIQGAYSGTMDFVYQQAQHLLEVQNQQQLDTIQAGSDARLAALDAEGKREDSYYDAREKALDKSQRAADKAFEKRWDAREKAEEARFDRQTDRLKAQIDAEKNADSERQKIFEAEQRRIERLTQAYNTNIDFNAALNNGNLDEAAKIFSTQAAQVQQYGMEDANRAADEASQKRQEQLQAQIDRIDQEKQARLDALKQVREAETEAFNDRQEQQKEALRAERERAQAGLDAAREKERKSTEASLAAAREQQRINQQKLELELLALQQFIPRNEAELNAHIGRVEATYRSFGIDLTQYGDNWSEIIATALHNHIDAAAVGLQNQINWQQIGQTIADRIEAGTGMSFADVRKFLESGQWPTGTTPRTTPYKGNQKGGPVVNGIPRPGIPVAQHSGGMIPHTGGKPFSQADRVGVRRGAGIMPSEVPALLKAGEFVMNQGAATRYQPILEMMNRGMLGGNYGDRVMDSLHGGGFVDHTAGLTGLFGAAMAKVQEATVIQAVKAEQARQAAAAAAMAAAGLGPLGGGGAPGSGVFNTTNRNWPPPRLGVLSSNTAGAVDFVKRTWPQITSIGTLGNRPNVSDHPLGKALDNMIPAWNTPGGVALGNSIANWFTGNPNAFGTKYVIWRKMITSGQGWEPYTHPTGASNPTLDHMDHVHVSLYHGGGLVNGMNLPQLNRGGFITRDGMAKLHEDEAVLTKPLTDDFKTNLATGGGNQYDVTIDLRGATIREEIDFERSVRKVLDDIDSRNGRPRKVS